MIVHSYYEEDPRVRREAEALVERGRPVDVIALRLPEAAREGLLNGVRITRLDVQRHQGAGLWVYLREYVSFLFRSGWTATRAHRRRRYGLIQVHSLPDFLVFAALPLKLLRVPVVLDLHEAMPEFFRPASRACAARSFIVGCISRSGCRSPLRTGSSPSTS